MKHTSPGKPQVHLWGLAFHCSAECGQPIRQGELYVQTSPDLKPLTRAHAACVAGRKGIDPERAAASQAVTDAAIGARVTRLGPPVVVTL